MKLWDVIKTVGTGVIREVVPGGGILVDAVNEFLPDDKKLPSDATGQDVDEAVASLPPAQQAQILEKEFDVDMTRIRQTNETVRAMLESDAKNQHTTRPYIAKNAFHVHDEIVAEVPEEFERIMAAVPPWASDWPVKAAGGWPFILSVIGPFVILLHAYFGVLKNEQKNRLDAAAGRSAAPGLTGMLSNLIRRK